MQNLAKEAGVSQATVSRALSGSDSVRPRTKRKILELAQRMGYFPKIFPGPRLGVRPPVIGVFSYFIDSWPMVEMLWGLSQELYLNRLNMLLYPFQGRRILARSLEQALEQGILGGVVCIGFRILGRSRLASVLEAGIPMVTVEDQLEGASSVLVDDVAGGQIAARHLEKSVKRFVVIDTVSRWGNVSQRAEAFRDELLDRGIPQHEIQTLTGADNSESSGYTLGKKIPWIGGQSLGVFCPWGDLMALGFCRAMAERGLDLGTDVRVIGYDNLAFARYNPMGLTTIAQPLESMGRDAAKLILEAFHNPKAKPSEKRYQPELIIRKTA